MTGKITKDAFVDAGEKFFKDADKNKDGFLSQKELTDALSALLPAPPNGPPGDRPPQRPGEQKKDKP